MSQTQVLIQMHENFILHLRINDAKQHFNQTFVLFLHFHSFLSGEHYSHKGLGYDHQPSYLSWWVVLQTKQYETREGAPKYMIIDCLFSHFEHKFQPSLPSKIIITKSTLRECFYHWGLMDRMKCLCVDAEALKNAKISSQTYKLSILCFHQLLYI